MKAQQKYGFSRTVEVGFDEARDRTIKALKQEGFGVLSEIRLDEKLKENLGVDFRRYVILGACNPSLAYKNPARGNQCWTASAVQCHCL